MQFCFVLANSAYTADHTRAEGSIAEDGRIVGREGTVTAHAKISTCYFLGAVSSSASSLSI